MKAIRFIHCADIHLDTPFKSLKNREIATARRKDLKETFSKIITVTKENKADMLLVSGDLFEHSYSRRSTMQFINEELSRLGKIPVIIVAGNHDPYVTNSYYRTFDWKENIYILHKNFPYIYLSNLKTYVYGLGFEGFYQNKADISKLYRKPDSEAFHILLFHGTVDMDFGENLYNPVKSDDLKDLKMDYIALGHFHKKKDDYKAAEIYNPGSPEPLGFDEQGEHGVFLVELNKEEASMERKVKFLKTARRNYKEFKVDISGCVNMQEIKIKILDCLEKVDRDKDIARIVLRGFIDKDYNIRKKELEEYFNNEYFYIEIQDCTYPEYDLDRLENEQGLRGVFVRKMKKRIDAAKTLEEKEIEKRALYLGLEAMEKGKLETLEE